MSTSPMAATRPQRAVRRVGLSITRPQAAALASVLTVAGTFAIASTALYLWAMWTTDPLKSIGGLVPIVSAVLILRVWRSLDWELDGTWWGLLLLGATVAVVHLRDHAILELILTPSWTIFLPPHSLVAFAYTAGAVLLFGGLRLFRAALFPIVLTWFVNPVPNAFNRFIDLPLQHASALVARGFAHALGQQLSPGQLRLMFTPDFGMFIAPGCDGIRGAITMGFLALVAGYLYRFRRLHWILAVVGAVLLGYLLNFARLCLLVVYYVGALHVTWLQDRARMGDYVIGACLFFVATALLFLLIRRWSVTGDLRPPSLPPLLSSHTERTPDHLPTEVQAPRSFLPRALAFTLLVLVGSVSYARALMGDAKPSAALGDVAGPGTFPEQVGPYARQREWGEHLPTGPLIFYWASYAAAGGGSPVSVGVSPVLGAHDTLICHSARGEDWLWHGTLAMSTARGPVSFSVSFFNDGATQYLEATTVCTGETCGQYSSTRRHFGLVYSRPDTRTLLTESPSRPIPILLRAETLDAALSADDARRLLTGKLQAFLTRTNLPELTRAYRHP